MHTIIKICTLCILLFSSHLVAIFVKAIEPEVCLSGLGCIEGIVKTGNQVQQYEAFFGIPFAKPPIGDLRFKNPVPAAWSDKLLAKEQRSDCLQKNHMAAQPIITGEEDCLYLNVYRPMNRSSENLPVLFYIHGGGLFSGSSNPLFHGPEYFMDTNEVILVIPNYRLGPFGFLSTDDEHMGGNYGLKDQNMALKWVQNHISAFGGDPARVTIFGHSAGSGVVHLHMLSPASKGLFRNAITMSGMANALLLRYIDEKANAIQLATAAGIPNASQLTSLELGNALRKVDLVVLLDATDSLKKWYNYPYINFRANIEKETWPDPFITENAFKLINNKTPQTVPWITGSAPALGEGTVMALKVATDPILQAELNQNFDERLSLVADLPFGEKPEKVKKMLDLLVAEYMGGVRELNNDTMSGFLEMLGDGNFVYPLYKTVDANVKTGNGAQIPAGIMQFNYRGSYSYSSFFTGSSNDFGAAHIDDSLYLFTMPWMIPEGFAKKSPEANIVKNYVGLFVEFAKTGNVKIFKNMAPCTKATLETRQREGRFCDYLKIANDEEPLKSDNTWNIQRMKLWDNVFETLF